MRFVENQQEDTISFEVKVVIFNKIKNLILCYPTDCSETHHYLSLNTKKGCHAEPRRSTVRKGLYARRHHYAANLQSRSVSLGSMPLLVLSPTTEYTYGFRSKAGWIMWLITRRLPFMRFVGDNTNKGTTEYGCGFRSKAGWIMWLITRRLPCIRFVGDNTNKGTKAP